MNATAEAGKLDHTAVGEQGGPTGAASRLCSGLRHSAHATIGAGPR